MLLRLLRRVFTALVRAVFGRPRRLERRGHAAFVARHCTGKIAHRDRSAARKHVREMEAKTGEAFSDYCCEVCGAFHVGHRRR